MSRIYPYFKDIFLFVAFYFAWFGAAWAAKEDHSYLIFLFPLVYLVLVIKLGRYARPDVRGIPWRLAVGLVFDAMMIRAGVMLVNTPSEFTIVPLWLIAIWLLFLFSLPGFEQPFSGRPIFAAVMGAGGALLSYRAGEVMHLIRFTTPLWAAFYAVFWTIYFPLAVRRPTRALPSPTSDS